MEHKNKMVIWFVIVAVVIAILVMITMKGPMASPEPEANVLQAGEGVRIAIITEGAGAGALVTVNYVGILEDGTVFDSNVDPKFSHVEPYTFVLGEGSVIPGWEVGIVGMKVGERRILEINPEYAYGATGYPPVIPPNAVLAFQIELLSVE